MKIWNVGDRVLARWFHDPFWYPATIREVDGERYYVKFDDGDKQWTPAEFLTQIDIEEGDPVFGRWQAGPEYLPGRVEQIGPEERIFVKYVDGDEEWTTISMVRVTR